MLGNTGRKEVVSACFSVRLLAVHLRNRHNVSQTISYSITGGFPTEIVANGLFHLQPPGSPPIILKMQRCFLDRLSKQLV